jgi:hypothetical protein
MDIDLLTKLVKLANHNPNENESNAAARKVCSLIEAANFNFDNSNMKNIDKGAPDWWYQNIVDMMNMGREYNYTYAQRGGKSQYNHEAARKAAEEKTRREEQEERDRQHYNKQYHVDWVKK